MNDASLVMTCNYHFGNTPSLFAPAAFVGCSLSLPMRVVWLNDDPTAQHVTLVFKTQDVETWGDWKGHRVLIQGEEVGRLKDPADDDGRYETFELPIEKARFEELIGPSKTFVLTIELETQEAFPGLSDDFLLRRVEAKNAAIRLGV